MNYLECDLFDHFFPDDPLNGPATYTFRVFTEPMSWQLSRQTPRRGNPRLIKYKRVVRDQVAIQRNQSAFSGQFPIVKNVPIRLRMRIFITKPDRPACRDLLYPSASVIADYDNFGKAAQDGANKILWDDDCQVINGGTIIAWARFPYPEQEIALMDPGVIYDFAVLNTDHAAACLNEYHEGLKESEGVY